MFVLTISMSCNKSEGKHNPPHGLWFAFISLSWYFFIDIIVITSWDGKTWKRWKDRKIIVCKWWFIVYKILTSHLQCKIKKCNFKVNGFNYLATQFVLVVHNAGFQHICLPLRRSHDLFKSTNHREPFWCWLAEPGIHWVALLVRWLSRVALGCRFWCTDTKNWNLGWWVGVRGGVFTGKANELSVLFYLIFKHFRKTEFFLCFANSRCSLQK